MHKKKKMDVDATALLQKYEGKLIRDAKETRRKGEPVWLVLDGKRRRVDGYEFYRLLFPNYTKDEDVIKAQLPGPRLAGPTPSPELRPPPGTAPSCPC